MTGRLLVTGASGLLGQRLAAQAHAAGWQVIGTYYRHPLALSGIEMCQLDLLGDVEQFLVALCPDAVVHTAYSRQAHEMWRVVVEGSAAVARSCAVTGARLIHLSSDALFAGRPEPYTEDNVPEPITPYGAAKAVAEALVSALCPTALLIRTSLLYTTPDDHADPNRMLALKLFHDPSQGSLFVDEYRCPLCVDDLAAAIVELLDSAIQGVLHVAGPVALSRYEFSRLLLRAIGFDPTSLPAGSARSLCRPTHVVLDSTRARSLLRTELRSPYHVLGGHL